MSDSANVTGPHGDEMMTTSADSGKGKGKAMDTLGDVEMGEDDDSEEEEEEAGEGEDDAEEEEEDNLEEIDTSNIVEGGRRTRGRVIDFAKAAENSKDLDDEDEDEDEDFQAPDEEMGH